MAYGKQEGCQQIVYQKWRVATEFYVIASRRLYEEGKLTSADLHDAHFQSTMGNFSGNSRLDVMESRSWNMDPPRGLVELNQRANYDDLIKQSYSKEQADLHMGIWSALAGMGVSASSPDSTQRNLAYLSSFILLIQAFSQLFTS